MHQPGGIKYLTYKIKQKHKESKYTLKEQ